MSDPQLIARRYVLQDLIGQGGMGKVYRGLDIQTAQPVAIKHLRSDILGEDPDLTERFTREGDALRQLDHPNIVKILANVQNQTDHYLIMEYVGGGSLAEVLRKQPRMSVQRVLYIALDLADALTRAHRLNIIHRDIKPDNVLLAEDGTPRLTDFGVARIGAAPQITRNDSVIGTYAYLSPEAFSSAEPDARTDVWAFGVMMFEMLAGHRPFHKEDLSALIMAIMTEPVPDLQQLRPDVPVALIDLIYRMLEKNRDRRLNSVRLIGAELEAIINGKESSSPALVVPAEPRFETPTPHTHGHYHNLPASSTALIGRETEMEQLHHLLDDNRLVTILGPGGMGKTRLSLAAAEDHLQHAPDGVYFVPLAPVTAPTAIVPAVAEALKFSFYEETNTKGQLIDHLRSKELLLVLDNFEHVIAGAEIVSDILSAAPNVKILVTSRERLNLSSEVLFPIQGIPYPPENGDGAENYAAVRLFVQNAARVQHGFALDDSNKSTIAQITRLVQGMPLGIELAAAWTEMLSPAEIAEEIEKSLDFLETNMRDVPERHRSIRAVFEYSWNTMNDEERAVFQQMAVFRGSFSRDAAQKVVGASLRSLTSLVNKSLLKRDMSGRYEVHELLRQYAEERLNLDSAAAESARDRHSSYYIEFLSKLESSLKDERQVSALREIAADVKNVRAAWRWALDHLYLAEIDKAMEALWLFYEIRGWFREGLEMFTEATQQCEECNLQSQAAANRVNAVIVGRARARQGWFAARMGKRRKAQKILEESIALLKQHDAPADLAFSYLALGRGDTDESMPQAELRDLFQQALAIYRERNDRWGMALALIAIGDTYRGGMDLSAEIEQGLNYVRESLKIRREIGDQYGIAEALSLLAIVAGWMNQSDEAEKMVEEALRINREIGSDSGVTTSLLAMGITASSRGDLESAAKYYRECLAMRREIGNLPAIASVIGILSWNAYMQGNYQEALQLGGESLSIFGGTELAQTSLPGFIFGKAHVSLALGDYQQALDTFEESRRSAPRADTDLVVRTDLMMGHTYLLMGQLADAEPYFNTSLQGGYNLENGENIGNAQDRLGRLAYARGDYARAREWYQDSLKTQQTVGNRWGIAEAYSGLGEVALCEDQVAQAQQHFRDALASALPTGVAYVMLRALKGLAGAWAAQGDLVQAVELYTLVIEHSGTWQDVRMSAAQNLMSLTGKLASDDYAKAVERGKNHDLVAYVRELVTAQSPTIGIPYVLQKLGS
jgi:serine/threonine protein kinase/tetratricopeptide (TPR) repeat protein